MKEEGKASHERKLKEGKKPSPRFYLALLIGSVKSVPCGSERCSFGKHSSSTCGRSFRSWIAALASLAVIVTQNYSRNAFKHTGVLLKVVPRLCEIG